MIHGFFGWLVGTVHLHQVLLKTQAKNASEMHEMLKAALSGFFGSNMETSVDFKHSGIFP
jgi:hypothetical protein